MGLLKQSTAYNRTVLMTDSADHVTGKTGLTLTITASKAGAAFSSITPTVTDLGSGWYSLALTTTHTNTLGDFDMHITGTSADPTDTHDQVIAADLADAVRLGLSAIPNATAGANNGLPLGNASGFVGIQTGTGAGQLDFTSGVVKSNLAQILGTALTETAGLIAAGFKKFFNVATPTGTVNSLPDAVAGAANGLLISGANTGPMSVSGGVTFSNSAGDGLTLSSSGSNGSGLKASGNGSGSGLQVVGGATGAGLWAKGGSTTHTPSGRQPGAGILVSGGGAQAGVGQNGVDIQGDYANGATGLLAFGVYGIAGEAYAGGAGFYGFGGPGNSEGMKLVGTGSSSAFKATGGDTGHGMLATGGATSGDGLRAVAGGSGDGIHGLITFPTATVTGVPTTTSVTCTGLSDTTTNAYKDAYALFLTGTQAFSTPYPVATSSYSGGTTTLTFAGLLAAPTAADTLILIGSKKAT